MSLPTLASLRKKARQVTMYIKNSGASAKTKVSTYNKDQL